MRYFLYIASFIWLTISIATASLFDDWEDTSNALPPSDEDGTPTDMLLASTDFSTQDPSGGEIPNISESNDLGFGLLQDDHGISSGLLANTPDECSIPAGKKRVRRDATECTTQGNSKNEFPDYTNEDMTSSIVTHFDQQYCPPWVFEKTPLFVCSSPDPSKTIWMPQLISWVLFDSTHSMVPSFSLCPLMAHGY